jgi:hypothetical protein
VTRPLSRIALRTVGIDNDGRGSSLPHLYLSC